jgi:hypothetical protein
MTTNATSMSHGVFCDYLFEGPCFIILQHFVVTNVHYDKNLLVN